MIFELRQALRSLARARAFAAVVVLILGLGIGVNTAIFSVVRAVLLRPLPFQEPDRLVRLYESFRTGGGEAELALAPLTWQRWRESNAVFEDIGAATGTSLTLGGGGEPPQYVAGARVSFNFFSVLGVRPVRGRDFHPEDDQPGAPPVVLLGHGLWQRRFGGADVVGRSVMLDGVPHTIVGVMPESFRHPYRAELWVPLALRIDPVTVTGRFLYAPARLQARRRPRGGAPRDGRAVRPPRPGASQPHEREGGDDRSPAPRLRARPPAQDPRHHRRRGLRAAHRGGQRREPPPRAPRRAGERRPRCGPPSGRRAPGWSAASCWRACGSPPPASWWECSWPRS